MSRRPLRILSAGLVSLALLASCGDDKEDADTPSAATEDENTDDTETDDTESDDTASDPEETDGAEPDSTEADEPVDAGDAGCQVSTTGSIETSWSATEQDGSVLYGPWIPGVAATALDMNLDATSFILNCTKDDQGISFTGNGTFEIPMEPATYVISGEQGALGGGDAEIGAIINLGGDDLYGMAADGNLTITEFTNDHIAGTFELPVKPIFSETESDVPTATVTGSFRFENTSL